VGSQWFGIVVGMVVVVEGLEGPVVVDIDYSIVDLD